MIMQVGDFITVINLFKDVGLALKDSGGAASNFQMALRDLQAISNILLHLKKLKFTHGTLSEANAIRALAYQAQEEVQLFLDKIDKYQKTLGSRAPKGFHHGTLSKLRWAQFVQGQVNGLQLNIHNHMRNISALMGMLHQAAHEESQRTVLEEFSGQKRLINDLTTKVDSARAVLGQDISSAQSQVSQSLQSLGQDLTRSTNKAYERASAQFLGGQTQLSKQLSDVSVDVGAIIVNHRQLIDTLKQIKSETATSEDLDEIRTLLVSLKETYQKPSAPPVMSDDHRITLALTIPCLRISLDDIRTLLRRHFRNEVESIVHILFASFLAALREFLWALPQLVLVAKFMGGLPRSVSSLLSDNIKFEDALGRFQSLQFQQFRNWPVFEAHLLCTFENSPGFKKVFEGHFILTSPKYPGRLLNASNWNECVSARIAIVMSISMRMILPEKGGCPRGCGSRIRSISDTESRCLNCDLVFSLEKKGGMRVAHVQVSASTGFKAKRRPEDPVVQKSQPSDHDLRDKPGVKGKWGNASAQHRATNALDRIRRKKIFEEQNQLDETEELKLFKRVHFEIEASQTSTGWFLPSDWSRLGAGSGARPRRGAFVLSSQLGVFEPWSMPIQSSSRRLHPKYRRFPYAESSSDDEDEVSPGFNWLMDKEDK